MFGAAGPPALPLASTTCFYHLLAVWPIARIALTSFGGMPLRAGYRLSALRATW